MATDFGLSFSPATTLDRTKTQADPNAPVQEAIRTLSLRIPKVTGGKGIAPGPLLNSLGGQGMGMPGGMGLEQLIAMLFGQKRQPQGPQSPGGAPLAPGTASFGAGQTSQPFPSAPSSPSSFLPRVRPGIEAPALDPEPVSYPATAPAPPSSDAWIDQYNTHGF